jgi:hydroxyisourate hydrolase
MSVRSPITTHVLDTASGRPARGVPITLEKHAGGAFAPLGDGTTDDDGRLTDLLEPGTLTPGLYRITFDVDAYYAGAPCFYPKVQIEFRVVSTDEHYHVPLLLSPFGYSTYRGS